MLILSNDQPAVFEKFQKTWGLRTVSKPVEELLPLYEKADRDEARQVADRWIKEAEQVIEPTRETIEKAARVYLAMRTLMKQHNADAHRGELHLRQLGREVCPPTSAWASTS